MEGKLKLLRILPKTYIQDKDRKDTVILEYVSEIVEYLNKADYSEDYTKEVAAELLDALSNVKSFEKADDKNKLVEKIFNDIYKAL